jgi:hypothetical protein
MRSGKKNRVAKMKMTELLVFIFSIAISKASKIKKIELFCPHFAYFLCMCFGQRAAENREILTEQKHLNNRSIFK